MGRSWRYVAGWLAVTVTAVTVSWFGVRLGVAPAISDEPPVAIDVNRRYTEIRFGQAETEPPAVRPSPAVPSPSKARPSRASTTPAPRRTVTSRPVATTPAVPPSSASPSPSPSEPDLRPRYRITADGGSVTVAYSSTRVDVVGSDPLSGHTVSIARRGEIVVVARLSTPGHTSVITAYWNNGPSAQIVEEYAP